VNSPDLALLRSAFDAAVAAADPLHILPAVLGAPPRGRVFVCGAGKAAASMALAVERAWPDAALEGLVITRYGHGLPTQRIRVVEAGHPVPDEAGEAAGREMLARAAALGPGDLLLALVSGGGSSLLAVPAEGLAMTELKQLTAQLLASGAPIEQMNVVRKHLSAIAGGQLALAAAQGGASVRALIVSDVTGDQPADIASGPCAPDPSTYADALAVLARWGVSPPAAARDRLERGASGALPETPKPGDTRFERVSNQVVATAHGSLRAAAAVFEAAGVRALILGDTVTGEAREVAKVYAALVREIHAHAAPFAPPVALLSGGECTVTLPAGVRGRGGRCSEFLVSLALELEGVPGLSALAADTDGIDGSEDNAGACFDADLLAAARRAGASPRASLDAHDAWGYFHAAGGLVHTGPTRTNVNDFRAILVR
jgi:hydroxypyruvate reductase